MKVSKRSSYSNSRCASFVFAVTAITSITCTSSILAPGLSDYNDFQLQLLMMTEPSGNRSLIMNDIIVDHQILRKFSKSLVCVKELLEGYFRYPNLTMFVVPEVLTDVSGLAQAFVDNLKMNMAYVLSGKLNTEIRDDATANALILIKSASKLENATCCLINICGRSCHFAVMLTDVYEDVDSFLEESHAVIRMTWSHSIGKIVVVGIVNEMVMMVGSVAYKSGTICSPTRPVLLRSCKLLSGQLSIEFHKSIERPPLDGCIVKTSYFNNHPYAFELNDTIDLDGIEGLIVTEIMRSLNAGVIEETITWTNETYSEEEVKSRLSFEQGYDLVFGGLLWAPHEEIDFTVCYDLVQIVWLIPMQPNVSLKGLVTSFSWEVWIAICVTLVVGRLISAFVIREFTCLDILGLIMGFSIFHRPKRTSSRLEFLSWVILGFFLTEFYLCHLSDQLMSEASSKIQTVKELVESGLKFGGPGRFVSLFEEFDEDEDEEGNKVVEYIQKNFIVFENDEYIDLLADLISGRNSSVALIVMLNVSHDHTMENGNSEFYMLKESMGSYPLALATWRGLPYLGEINYRIQSLVQGGLVQYWTDKVMSVEMYESYTEETESNKNLKLEQLVPGFLLLLIGFSSGFCMLILEIMFYPSKLLE